MILMDDVTLTHKFPGKLPERLWPLRRGQRVIKTRKKSADSIYRDWEVIGGRGFVIRYCPQLGHVEARLSIPRLGYAKASPLTYNFPLADSLPDLGPVSEALVKSLHLTCALKGRKPAEALRLLEWPVRRVAFAVDVRVMDVAGSISAVSNLRRTGNPVQSWGSPPHACQWAADSYRFMVYSKQHEIRARRGQIAPPLKHRHDEFDKISRDFREALIAEAAGVVRLETTLWPKTLRGPWGAPGGFLPTLETLLRVDVIAYFMGEQVLRLKLDAVPPTNTKSDDEPDENVKEKDPAAVAFMFHEALTRFEQSGKKLSGSGGSLISCSRVCQMKEVYRNSGVLDDETLCRVNRMAPQTLAARRRNLRELGLPCIGSAEPHAQRCLRELVTAVRAVLPSWPKSPPKLGSEAWSEAPWLDMLPERQHDDDCDVSLDDDVAEGLDDMLVGLDDDPPSVKVVDLDIVTLLRELDAGPDMGLDDDDDLLELLAS